MNGLFEMIDVDQEVVGLAPGPNGGVFVRGEVVPDQVHRLSWPAASQAVEEGEELA